MGGLEMNSSQTKRQKKIQHILNCFNDRDEGGNLLMRCDIIACGIAYPDERPSDGVVYAWRYSDEFDQVYLPVVKDGVRYRVFLSPDPWELAIDKIDRPRLYQGTAP